MDKTSKAKIKNLVLTLRHSLERDVVLGLKRHGILADRDWLPETRIPRPNEDILRRRARIAAVIQATMDQGYTRQEATQEYIRRAALTSLIRLVGLKCLEVRGLIDEVITTRVEYGSRSLFHRDFRYIHPELAAQSDDALPAALEAACRLVTREIHVLFDPDDDWSIIQPRSKTLKDAITPINDLPNDVWLEDEIVGWVYQFYRTKDRDRVRKRGRPQKADDVAAINQFYTPRWVVQFLVDNTLGRLWLEMHPDSHIRQKCTYLVPATDLPHPGKAPVREAKPPWEIRLLDPACGTMHFGFYASDLFLEMYQETKSRGWADTLPDGRSIFELTKAEIVSLIFRYNLFGITIDTWAAHLAILSLYMKLKDLCSEAKVISMNVICADAYLPEGEVRGKFLDEFGDDHEMRDALGEIFDTMGDIGQVGSLFRPREQLRLILENRKHPTARWEEQQKSAAERRQTPIRQRELGEITGPGAGWRVFRPLDEVLEKLRGFARQYWVEQNHVARILALETEENLRLLDVLLQSYDVVVMNPPYGRTTIRAKQYLRQMYPQTHHDLYTAFLERGLMFLSPNGYLGSLTSRTFLTLSTFERFRKRLFCSVFPILIFELGFGVLDESIVETCASVIKNRVGQGQQEVSFMYPQSADISLADSNFAHIVFRRSSLQQLRNIPGYQAAPRAPDTLLRLFIEAKQRVRDLAPAKMGLATGKDEMFVRYHWEIVAHEAQKDWRPFAKGGDFSRYYADVFLLVDWTDAGKPMLAYPGCRKQGVDYYFRSGITWPWITVKGFNARYLPSDCIFANISPLLPIDGGIPVGKNDHQSLTFGLLGFLNSTLMSAFLDLITPSRNYTVGQVNNLPLPELKKLTICAEPSLEAYHLKAAWDTGNEICSRFTQPWLLQLAQPQDDAFTLGLVCVLELLGDDAPHTPTSPHPVTLAALLDCARAIETAADARLQHLQAQVDETVYDLYEISPADRALIERELGNRPPELVWPQMAGKSDQEKRREHVRRLLSHFVLQALQDHPAGVLPLVEGTSEPTVLELLRERLEVTFSSEVAFQLEDDAGRVLDKSVVKWLDGDFIKWHTRLYKRRPVIWHIASPRRAFGVFVYCHKLDRDTLPKVRNVYLRTLRDRLRLQLDAARTVADYKAVDRLEAALDDLAALDERMGRIIEAGYDPSIDDGVKANILPLQEAGILRFKKVI
ncbi:MAG: hypothetical protein SXV54_28140 [Chloroflexota bacterium]|nr:hypothetical protein [Chloroflexota bacterium]